MNRNSTSQFFKHYLGIIVIIIAITLFNVQSYAQTKNYATVTPSTGVATYAQLLGGGIGPPNTTDATGGTITDPGNAAVSVGTDPAKLRANYVSLLVLGKEGEAWIQLKYDNQVSAGTTTYIPFDTPTTTGLTIDLLGTLGDLTGLFSKQFVTIDAYDGATSTNDGTIVASSNVTNNIVKDKAGKTYFAVTSSVPYNSVRVRLRYRGNLLGVALLNASLNMNVYSAFNYSADNCGSSIFTDIGKATGLNVSLTNTVINPERAIDGNPATFSQLQPGLIALGSSISQTVFLDGLSSSSDVAKVVLSQPGSVLTVNVLSAITLQAYNGTTPVGAPQSLSSLLSLDLLGLFSNNTPIPTYFTPGAPFDRVTVTVQNAVGLGGNILAGGLNINEVQRTVAKPTFAGFNGGVLGICGGSSLTLAAQNPNPAFTYNFYKDVNGTKTSVASANAGTYTETGLAPGTYTYYMSAQKAGCLGESDTSKVTVTVKPVLQFATTTLNNAMAAKVYAKQITPATGGTAGYTYALAAGSTLPAGLVITPAGLISGTPSATGDFNFNLIATDAFGCSATASYTLKVTATLTMPTAVLPNGTINKPYPSTVLPTPAGGSTPYSYTAVNLPPGLSLDAATGTITGTPTVLGPYTFPVTVTDADGNTVIVNYSITVRDVMALPPATFTPGTTGVAFAQSIPSATGGSGVYTYAATGLPGGLNLNTTTGAITGTPTLAGTYAVVVTASDNEGNTASATYSILVRDPLVLATATLPNGTIGVVYPVQTIPAATGGVGPYTYLATNLPAGLLFDPVTRQITGTPTKSGTFTVSVKVTDAENNSITVPYTIKVTGTLVLPDATLANGTVGVPYTPQTIPLVTGGIAPYTYTATNLPDGLNFNTTTHVISGTPTKGGNFTATITVTDNSGLSTSTDYPINILIGTPTVAGVEICSGNTATLTVSNPINGVTYNFYAAAGNTPLATGTSTTFTTGTLTQTTTFYAEAVSGTAVSARVPVTVTVNPLPDLPTVTTTNLTISSGQTATLQATAAAGATISWYANATGGVALGSGPSFTTPALSATTTYYAGTANGTGCSSQTRVPVIVTVINSTPNPVCNAASTQQSSISGGILCVGCAITGAGNSTDNDPSNFTQISIPVGVGASAYQRLIFQNPGTATDSIRVDLETPISLVNLTAIGGITLNVMNGTTVVKSYPINSQLLNLQLLNGNRFQATVLAGGAYDRIEVNYSPTVSALSTLNIYGAQIIYPNPTITAGSQTICSGGTANLNVTPQGGTTLSWYSAATGGTALASGNTFTTPALTATTTYYIQVSKNGCANTTRVPVVITVTPLVDVPVLATVVPVCSNTAAVLSVDSPQAGITYNWYTTATGGTPVATGTTFTTPVLTANATYYVEGSNGNCVSATRTAANIIVNPLPVAPQIQASATTVNSGQTVSLTGTSTEANVTFNWYDSATSTTPLFTGAVYVTPALTQTTTFYLSATSTVTGCASSSRVQQTITVNGSGTPVPTLCENPVSQSTGVGGIVSVLARVDNPALAIDGDQQTGSTLNIPVGVGSNVFQKVNFTGLSNVGDTVKILLNSPGKLLSLSVLPSVTLTTYNGNTSNNDATTINNPLIGLQLLNSGNSVLVTLVPTAQFDGVAVQLNSGVLGAFTSINFNYARRITQAPVVAAASVTACANQTATLTVTNPQPGIVYKWYDASGNYLGNDGTTFVTPVITADTKFFAEASRGGCGGSRTAVTVTLVPDAQPPVLLSATEATCVNSNLVLQVQNPQAGVTFQWYKDGVLIPGEVNSSYAINNIQTGAVYSVAAINSCNVASAQTSVTITVGSLAAPVVQPVTINSGEQTQLIASSSTSGLTYSWYDVDPATPGAAPISTPTNGQDGKFITPVLTANKTYYVTATNGAAGCQSAAAAVLVTVNTVGQGATVPCEAAVTQSTRNGGTLAVTSVSNPGFAVDNDVASSSSLFIAAGVNGFVAQKVGFTGLSQVGDKIRLRISSPAGLLSLAVAPSITLTTYNGNTSNGDEKVISSSGISLQILPNGTSADIELTPAQVFDGVELKLNSGVASLLTSVNLNYAQRVILPPVVTADTVTICQGKTADLSVNNPLTGAGITYSWYKDGVLAATTSTYSLPVDLAAGTYTYSVSVNRGACESAKTPVTVIVIPGASAPVASTGNPVTTCQNASVTLRVDQVAGISYNWYDAATGGNLLASNTNAFTTPANLAVGTTDFYVEATNSNSCASTASRTKISITVNPDATVSDLAVTGATAICSGDNVILKASSTTVTAPVFTWYSDAALTNAVFTGDTFSPTGITATTSYYVTVRGTNKCENNAASALKVTIQVNPKAVAADVTVSVTPAAICEGTAFTLSASSTTVTNPVFNWYSDAALTNKLHTGPDYTANAVAGSTNYYVTVQGTNKCANAAANAKVVTLSVNPPAVKSDILVTGVPATVCSGSGASLTATSLTVINPVFTWYTDAALTNAVFTGPTFQTPVLTTATTYYVTVQGLNKCPNTAATAVAVTLNVNAVLTFNGGALPAATVFTAYTAQAGPATGGTPGYIYTLALGSNLPAAVILLPTGQLSGIPTTPGNYTFSITATDSKGCNQTAVFTLVVNPNTSLFLPPATLPNGEVGTVYVTQTLPAAVGGTAPYTYTVIPLSLPPGLQFDPATRQISGTPTLGGSFTIPVTVTDANGLTATTNYVIIVTVPAPTVAAAQSCGGKSVTLTVVNPIAGVIYNWYGAPNGGLILGTGTSFQTPPVTSTTTYYVAGTSGTATSSRTAATVTLNPSATAADITITGIPATVCSGTTASLTAASTTVTNPVFTWYTDAALTNAVFTGATFITPGLITNTTYYVTVQGSDKCENTSGTAKTVILTVNPVIVFNGSILTPATAASPYTVQIGAPIGGTPGYTYIVASGSTLPDGLSLSASGVLSGTPTTPGMYVFSITTTDSKGCNATASFSLTVNAANGTMSLPPAILPDGIVGTAYVSLPLPAAIGGTAPYTYTALASSIPPGLQFDPVTRQLTGTPTLGGNFSVTVTAKDANGLTATTNYSLVVIVPAPAADGVLACPGSQVTLTVNNPLANVTYNWYGSANGGAILGTGISFQTPVITAPVTYYVSGTSGTATSSRTPVAVTLKPAATAADIIVTGIPATAICSGTGVTLTASSLTVTNPVFTWYSDAALTKVVSNDAALTVPTLNGNTTYYVTVEGSNKCKNASGSARVVVLTVNPALSFMNSVLANGAVLVPYTAQIGAATGGTPGYTYTVASGNILPAALVLSPTGLLTGLPAVAGTYTFAITATDSKGCNATANFSLTIGQASLPVTLPPAILPDGLVGTPYPTQTLPAANGGTGPYTYSVTGLPNGLQFDPLTENITGTPTLGGTFTLTLTAKDANGLTGTGTYIIVVKVPAPTVASTESCGGNSVTLTVTNPIAGVTYNWYSSAIGGSILSSGTSFQTPAQTATATYYAEAVSGTAVSSRTAVTVTYKAPATAADITVTGAPATVCAGSGVTLTATSTTVNSPVFTWYSDAALQNKVSTDATFSVPALTATTTYYVTVKGANVCENVSGSAKVVVLNVNAAIVFNGGTLSEAKRGRVYSAQIGAATGGTPGYTYTLTAGSTLPDGLTLSPAGVISGTPVTLGNNTFSITVTDSKGCTAVASFTLNVIIATDEVIILPPATFPNGVVGSTYPTQTLPAATGGTAPYTYTATNLPPGLRFDPATREITGVPTLGGTFTITVSVTDAGGLTAARDYVITVTVPAPVVAGAQSCSGSSVTLSVTNPVTGVTYNWYANATGGSILTTGPDFQTPAVTTTTNYFVEAVSGTASSGRIAVSVSVASVLDAPVVTVASSNLFSITFSWNAVSGATGYEVSADGGKTWTAPSSGSTGTTHLVTGLQANSTLTLMVRAIGTTTCQTSASGSATGTATDGGGNNVFIPNTFTPNGDGKNDIFYVYGNAIAKVRMRIYNQWGQFIYESLQIQNGWDGTYKGQLQPNGVYVYYVELTFTDGTTSLKKGSITLLR